MPPPGRKPIGTSPSSPFRASLNPPSPENTITASHPAREASLTILVACCGCSVFTTVELGDARELVHDRGEPRVGDARRERIDDENCLHLETTLP